MLLAFDSNPRTCAFKADIQCAIYQGFLMMHILLVFLPPKVLEYVSSNMSDFGRWSTLTFASVQIAKKCWGLPKLHISLHSDHHSVLWWSKRQWWVTFPPFFSHPSVRPFHCTMAILTRFLFIFSNFILMPDTCWRRNTDIRIGNVWFSTMGTLKKTLPFQPQNREEMLVPDLYVFTKVIYTKYSKQFKWNSYFYVSGQNQPFWAALKLL